MHAHRYESRYKENGTRNPSLHFVILGEILSGTLLMNDVMTV